MLTYLEFIDRFIDHYNITIHTVNYINWQYEYQVYLVKGEKYFGLKLK